MKKIKSFTKKQLLKSIEKGNLAVTVDTLISMGNRRGWLTRKGKPFKNCDVFANCMNGVYLQEIRKYGLNEKSEYDLFSDDIVSYINEK